jgi:serine protease Do
MGRFVFARLMSLFCVSAVLVLFAGAVPASANYESARRAYSKLERSEKATVTLGLIATGDFDGLAWLGFTKTFYSAVIAFQKREGMKADGIISDEELAILANRFSEFSAKYKLTMARNHISTSETLIPLALLETEKETHRGVAYGRKDKQFEVSFEVFPFAEISYRDNFDQMVRPKADKRVTFKTITPGYFVVAGVFEDRAFTLFMDAEPLESTGFMISYSPTYADVGRQMAALMANAFVAVGKPGKRVPIFPDSERPEAKTPETNPPAAPRNSTGTGFRFTEAGHVMTNHHVVEQCKTIRLHRSGEVPVAASVVARDQVNDLAILKADGPLSGAVAAFSRTGSVRAGSEVVVFGFPLTGLLADSGNVTTGNITAMAGLGNDSRVFQISAPVQPGNSGGPMLDRKGGVVAVIVSKLDTKSMTEKTGDVPQNVNFAIKSSVVLSFVESLGLTTDELPSDSTVLDTPSLADQARSFTHLIECNNN